MNADATTHFATVRSDGSLTQALRGVLAGLIGRGVVQAVLTPARQAGGKVVMQTLITDPYRLGHAEPLAPVVWTNGGTLVSSLTFKPAGAPIAAVLRSCEVRAFVERAKLKQGTRQDLLLIGVDCLGRFENRDYLSLASRHDDLAAQLLTSGTNEIDGIPVAEACRACEYPVAPSVDLRVCLVGADPAEGLELEAVTDRGKDALEALDLAWCEAPPGRKLAVERLESERVAYRDAMFAAFEASTASTDGLIEATAACINCYNCRVACPVCYCRECVFTTDLFRHDGAKFLMWSRKRGELRMPTDTLFYHLTRMVHMSTMCVGCGQCSSACPNDIPVMELFRTTAAATQARFGYVPGRDFDEKQPMATFHDNELEDVTGDAK